jgi:hypothetical protein
VQIFSWSPSSQRPSIYVLPVITASFARKHTQYRIKMNSSFSQDTCCHAAGRGMTMPHYINITHRFATGPSPAPPTDRSVWPLLLCVKHKTWDNALLPHGSNAAYERVWLHIAIICWDNIAAEIHEWTSMEHRWNTDRGTPSTQRKPCQTATLSTINSTWTGLRLNLALRGEQLQLNETQYERYNCWVVVK